MKHILKRLTDHDTLTRQEAKSVLLAISRGDHNHVQIASFMTIFMMRSITVPELSGFRDALQELYLPVDMSDFNGIDLCGTGGDSKDTFNISTLASIVVAGAGEKVTKHGNYGVSSSCGSSNVMEFLGYKFTNNTDVLREQVDKAGICFMHAPLFHPAMKEVAPIRRELGVKTFFNVLGPLINPASPNNQLSGVFNLVTARLYNYILQQGDTNFVILHSLDGYDEISLTGDFKSITNQGEYLHSPEDLGLKRLKPEALFGGQSVKDSAKIFTTILEGKGTTAQNSVVLANAAMAIQCIDQTKSFEHCYERAESALMSGKSLKVLQKITA